MPELIYELFEGLEKQQTMLLFKGGLDENLIGAMLETVDKKMKEYEPSAVLRKRVFVVLTECLQNLQNHGEGLAEAEGRDGIIAITKNEFGYSVFTGNYMSADEVGTLRQRIEKINTLDKEQLKALYREVLNDGQFSSKGGGGLGIIDMARKSNRKLEYAFVPVKDNKSFFSLNVNVTEKT